MRAKPLTRVGELATEVISRRARLSWLHGVDSLGELEKGTRPLQRDITTAKKLALLCVSMEIERERAELAQQHQQQQQQQQKNKQQMCP